MKKAVLLLTSYFLLASVPSGLLSSLAFAQNQNLNSAISYYEDYTKYNELKSLPQAKEKIELAATNEATSGKFKTWYYRGLIYVALFELNLKNEMNKSTEADINKKLIVAYNTVSMAEVDEALKSFKKEIELDDKKIYINDANNNMRVIASDYSDKAYSCLLNKNYTDAISYYEKSYDMKAKQNIIDTAAVNNMAFSAVKIKDYKKAEQYYTKLIEMKYKQEKCYLSIIQMYTDAGDTASARLVINKSVIAMPDSYALLIEQINLFLRNGKSESAINSINLALAKDPKNHELHLVLGQTWNKMAFPKDAAGKDLPKPANFSELTKKADEEFSKAIEIKPDYFVGLYSIGIFYNNLGADIIKQAEDMKDPKKVKAEEDKADVLFQKAIPLLEKAHELDRTDKDTMRTLRQLYARTGQGDTDKYKKLNEELKGGK
ncbi:MAG: hypothetical protein HY841_03535 [Bacteroidetes bacterium]|nr:hypothetical protein [Bacteroidota bacterium]